MFDYHLLMSGFVLGISVAAPMGAINVEMMRRTLSLGLPYGLGVGVGASFADLTYLVLLSLGLLHFLEQPLLLKVIGIVGSLFIIYLALGIIRQQPQADNLTSTAKPKLMRSVLDGYVMAAFNPFNILFWAAVIGMQAQHAVGHGRAGILLTGSGLIAGTMSWVLFINIVLHCLRHRIPDKGLRILNICGGLLLLVFAGWSLYKALLS